MRSRTVLWGARRGDRQLAGDTDRQRQATAWFMYTHCHLERAPAPVGHAIGIATGRMLRRIARRLEGA